MTPSLYDRRKEERNKAIITGFRLLIEVGALVWAIAGLMNATSNLKENLIDIKADVKSIDSRLRSIEIKVK